MPNCCSSASTRLRCCSESQLSTVCGEELNVICEAGTWKTSADIARTRSKTDSITPPVLLAPLPSSTRVLLLFFCINPRSISCRRLTPQLNETHGWHKNHTQ